MKINVVYSLWGADELAFDGGVHDVTVIGDGTAESPYLSPAVVGGAEASGVIEVVEATSEERAALDAAVQSQEDGEAAYAAAQEDGSWHEGNLEQFLLTARQELDDPDAELTDERRAALERGIADAEGRRAELGAKT
jgi:hypothetical protein